MRITTDSTTEGMRARFSWLTGFFKAWVYQVHLKRRRRAEGWSDEEFYRKTFTHRNVPIRSTDKFATTRPYIAREIGSESRDGRILDLAAGFAFLASYLSEQGYRRVYAMDLVPYRIAHASRIHFPTGVKFLAGDMRSLCVPPASFDAITISVALHDLPTKAISAALRECNAAIRPGGRFVIMEPRYCLDISHGWFRSAYRRICSLVDESPYIGQYVGFDLVGEMRGIGFKLIRQQQVWGKILCLYTFEKPGTPRSDTRGQTGLIKPGGTAL